MPKKCVICEEEATFAIKDTNDYYCKDCAEEQFDDVSYLVKIEEEKIQQLQKDKKMLAADDHAIVSERNGD